jgi:hypothetical protein
MRYSTDEKDGSGRIRASPIPKARRASSAVAVIA